jgi:hypothetical protein
MPSDVCISAWSSGQVAWHVPLSRDDFGGSPVSVQAQHIRAGQAQGVLQLYWVVIHCAVAAPSQRCCLALW